MVTGVAMITATGGMTTDRGRGNTITNLSRLIEEAIGTSTTTREGRCPATTADTTVTTSGEIACHRITVSRTTMGPGSGSIRSSNEEAKASTLASNAGAIPPADGRTPAGGRDPGPHHSLLDRAIVSAVHRLGQRRVPDGEGRGTSGVGRHPRGVESVIECHQLTSSGKFARYRSQRTQTERLRFA